MSAAGRCLGLSWGHYFQKWENRNGVTVWRCVNCGREENVK